MPLLGTKPPIALRSVDLPAPFVPMSPITSFGSAWNATQSTATMPPKCTDSSLVRSTLPSSLSRNVDAAATLLSDDGGAVTVLATAGGMRFSSQPRMLLRAQ